MTSFVDLAKGGKSFGDIKKLLDDVYGDKALEKNQIYKILKQVKMGKNRRGFTQQKTKMTADLIASVADAVAEDRRVSIQDLARANGTSYGTISRILHSQLGLVKKSARWVPKLLSTPRRLSRSSWQKKSIKLLSFPPLFIWSRPSRLLPLPEAEEGAGRHHHDPGEVQEGVGGGPEENQQGKVREGFRAQVRVVRTIYLHRRKLCLEIVKNKFPSNYHCLLFINTFRYHLDFTSYLIMVWVLIQEWGDENQVQ
jgi:hypothetical protein